MSDEFTIVDGPLHPDLAAVVDQAYVAFCNDRPRLACRHVIDGAEAIAA